MTAYRPLIAAVLFSAALAGAQEVKPRVMVILDTSRSMLERPNNENAIIDMTSAGGDWDRANPGVQCENKLCTAKKVVDTVLSQYTADARIGLTTYYQFLLKASRSDTQQTQCVYDVLSPPNELRRFKSFIDLTGSGNTVCTGGANMPCTGSARRVNLPDEGPGASYPANGAGIWGRCKSGITTWATPTGFVSNGYVRPTSLPNTAPPPCTDGAVGCYTLTKTAATPNMAVQCQLYNDSSTFTTDMAGNITPPQTYSSADTNCAENGFATSVYSRITSKTLISGIRKYVATGATSCSTGSTVVIQPGGPMLPVTYVPTPLMGGIAVPETVAPNPSIGTTAGQWENFMPAGSCRSGAPCAMYRTSEPESISSGRAWYGFFNPMTLPTVSSATTSPLTVPNYTFAASNGNTGYTNVPGLAGTINRPATNSCDPGAPATTWPVGTARRFVAGTLADSFGIGSSRSTAGTVLPLGGRTDETPTRTGTDTSCSTGWPCDVTLESDTPGTDVWDPDSAPIYSPTNTAFLSGLASGDRRFRTGTTSMTPSATPTFTLRINNPAQLSCPVIGNTSNNPVITSANTMDPAFVTWTTSTPAGCDSRGPCQFSAPTPGLPVAPSAMGCPSRSRFNSATLGAESAVGILAGGRCEWNGALYTSTTYDNDGVLPDGGVTTGNLYRVRKMVLPGDSCGTTIDVTSISAPIPGGGYQNGYFSSNVTAGPSPGHATLTYLPGEDVNGPPETSPTRVNALDNPPGYAGLLPTSIVNRGGVTETPAPAIGAVVQTPEQACGNIAIGSVIQSNNLTLCAGSLSGAPGECSLRVVGPRETSQSCGPSEFNKPCYVCQYQPLTYSWQRATKTCTYSATRTEWRVDGAARTCSYTRAEWNTDTRRPPTRNCTYRVGVTRYDFTQPTLTWCNYFAVQTNFQSERTLYTYEYLTKGTELIGRANSVNTAGNLCTSTWAAGNAFAQACPEQRSCANDPMFPNLTPLAGVSALPANSTCRLRVGGAVQNTNNATTGGTAPTANGRYSNFQATTIPFDPVGLDHRSCEAADPPPAGPNSYKNIGITNSVPPSSLGPAGGFCSPSGLTSTTELKLVTDYYAEANFTDSNNTLISNTNPVNGTGANSWTALYASPVTGSGGDVYLPALGWSVTTNNTAFKSQGFGAVTDGGATDAVGALPARSIFVPLPREGDYSAVTQQAAIQQALRPCVLPSMSNPATVPGWAFDGGPDGMLKGGACVADERVREPAPCTTTGSRNCGTQFSSGRNGDITPLYGSLRNTYDYLVERWTYADDDKQCRPYFVVLATDGAENTPRGYTVAGSNPATSVEGLVASFRNSTYPLTRPDVRTFVIALGTGVANGAQLDALNRVASAGGTTQAFGATSLAQLEATLQTVFTNITQGVFSRSRPAIGSDGTRLYTAQFVRGLDAGSGPDQFGLLTAYRVNSSDGTFTIAWEHGSKLNSTSHPTRRIVIGLRKKIGGGKDVGAFAAGNLELVDQLDDNPSFPAPAVGVTPANVISFLTNKGESYIGSAAIRTSRLGPISHSAPIVVGKSPFDPDYGGKTATEKAEFGAFKTSADTRPVRVLVAAADGMLHSVIENSTAPACATAGESDPTCPSGWESWSYIPGSLQLGSNGDFRPLVQSLFKLKQGGWGARYLNDSVAVADVCGNGTYSFANNCVTANWKTVAFISQREGGRGVAAVDVSSTLSTGHLAGWDTGSPNVSGFLWDFADNDLGFTFSAPAAGRVKNSDNKDEFIAIFGGGTDDPGTGVTVEGRAVFIVNALTGNLIKKFNTFTRGGASGIALGEVIGRPATHRRTGANFTYLSSAYVASGPSLYALRFADAAGAPKSNVQNNTSGGDWNPDELFDPTSARNSEIGCGTSPCGTLQVRKVFLQTAGNLSTTPPTPPVYALEPASVGTQTGGFLPLITAPPIYNRPRVASLLVPSGIQSDLLVGTGDARDPNQPELANFRTNYFYAIHDFNKQEGGSTNDGRAMWINQFPEVSPDRPEQVVSEPAVITGCVIVATYTVPLTTAGCNRQGDTTLYGFDPLTGNLKNCLVYEGPGNPYAGQRTSVLKMGGVGIPSDLVVINDNVYLSTSGNGLMKAPVRVPQRPGAVRSYRRVK